MKFLILAIMSVLTFNAYAGQEGGGGGIGIASGNTIYLYDFLEAGIEESPYINTSLPDQMNAAAGVQNTMASPQVQQLIVNKLNEIYLLAPEVAVRFLDVIKTYQWRYVLPKVKETKDRGFSPVKVQNQELQLAYRDDNLKIVTIDREYLKRMQPSHQAGLYFHEVLYSLTLKDCIEGNGNYECTRHLDFDFLEDKYKSSYRARAFTSYLFHPSFRGQTLTSVTEFYNTTVNTYTRNGKETFIPYTTYRFLKSNEFSSQCDQLKAETNAILLEGSYAFQQMHQAVWKSSKPILTKYTIKWYTWKKYYPYLYTDASNNVLTLFLEGQNLKFPSRIYNNYSREYEDVLINNPFIALKNGAKAKPAVFDRARVQNAADRFRDLKKRHENTFSNQCITDDNIKNIIEAYSKLHVTTN